MKEHTINIEVSLTWEDYQNALSFDAFQREKGWKRALKFGVGLLILAGVSLYTSQAWFVTAALSVAGVALPTGVLLRLWLGMNKRSRAMGLGDQPKYVYTVRFGDFAVGIREADGGEREVDWSDVSALYAIDGNLYLYTGKKELYVLPHRAFAPVEYDLWKLIRDEMDLDRVFVQAPSGGKAKK